MTEDKSYEIFPGVRVTEASDISYNNGERLDISKFKQLRREWHQNGYSDQEVRDKLAKNNSLLVLRSWTDIDNKTFCFEVMVNAHETAIKTLSFDDACKAYGWKSFKHFDDGRMILPVE